MKESELIFTKEFKLTEKLTVSVDLYWSRIEDLKTEFPKIPIEKITAEMPKTAGLYIANFRNGDKQMFSTVSVRVPFEEELLMSLREVVSFSKEDLDRMVKESTAFPILIDHSESNLYPKKYKLTSSFLIEGKGEFDMWYDIYFVDDIYRAVYYARDRKTNLCAEIKGEIGYEKFPDTLDIKKDVIMKKFEQNVISTLKFVLVFLTFVVIVGGSLVLWFYLRNRYTEATDLILLLLGSWLIGWLVVKFGMFISMLLHEKLFMSNKLNNDKNE